MVRRRSFEFLDFFQLRRRGHGVVAFESALFILESYAIRDRVIRSAAGTTLLLTQVGEADFSSDYSHPTEGAAIANLNRNHHSANP